MQISALLARVCSYIGQRLLWSVGLRLTFHEPWVIQVHRCAPTGGHVGAGAAGALLLLVEAPPSGAAQLKCTAPDSALSQWGDVRETRSRNRNRPRPIVQELRMCSLFL